MERNNRCFGIWNICPGQMIHIYLCVCWQSIYFESLEALILCIEAISADHESQVERVINRLNHEYDSSTIAGYRDVALNLRLKTPDTVCMGLDGHICEVQLVMISFARIKVQRTLDL